MASGGRASLHFLILVTTLLQLSCSSTSSSSSSTNQTKPQSDRSYYDLCAPFNCSNITFPFPFSSSETFGSREFDCGLPRFRIACDASSVASIEIAGRSYQVKELYRSDLIITLVDSQLAKDVRLGICNSLQNLTIPSSGTNDVAGAALALPLGGTNLTVLRCPVTMELPGGVRDGVAGNYSCTDGARVAYVWAPSVPRAVPTPSDCDHVALPISGANLSLIKSLSESGGGSSGGPEIVSEVLSGGFQLQWTNLTACEKCQKTGGRCGYDGSTDRIKCFCEGCTHKKNKWKIITGAIAGSLFVLLVMLLILFFYYKGRSSEIFKRSYYGKNEKRADEKQAKEFIREYRSTILTNYSYNDVKKMTKGFNEKLGQGGYGKVFKGKFPDGRLVAVKMLENYADNNSNFLNEVNTIGRIHHVNVIRLLGFCWDGTRQALIYEYMANKSLGDLIFSEGGSTSLGLPKLLEIAVGVAHGLEYLHNNCDSRILHLDIKPQNVLLDHNLNPKISDFGLAKVYSRNQSAVAMTGARGTIGYIAPEIFLRNFGNPSHKSDVYSFGMLLLEMVGARRQLELELEKSSTGTYFPGWIYDKLVQEIEMEEFVTDVIEEEDLTIHRKMVMVGLWCIHINPRDRPSMIQVAEMLSGNLESIKMPPKPFSFSHPRVQIDQETISIESECFELPLTRGLNGSDS